MSIQESLNVVTLVMCIITLAMSTATMLPQIKTAMVIVRDVVLWGILISVLGVVGVVGWGRFHEAQQRRAKLTEPEAVAAEFWTEPTLMSDSPLSSNRSTRFTTGGRFETGPRYREP